MASIRLRPTRGSTNLIRRSLVTSARLADTYSHPSSSQSSSSSSLSSESQNPIKNPKTFEFLYGPESNWRKPKVPSKPATPPKKRAKVDPEAYKNLPPLENVQRERLIDFSLAEGQSNERRAYFASDIEAELGEEVDWSGMEVVEGEVGLENGRVVECRRSGHTSLGLILASITLSGKPRLLLLRSTGEIWPISSHDVQFVMPPSLISPTLASQCWSPELLESLSQIETKSGLAEESSAIKPTPEMLSARRKVAMILRKVHRETEKMCGRLMAGSFRADDGHRDGGQVGGIESVWQNWQAQQKKGERTSITAVQAAEFILNPRHRKQEKKIEVKSNTLPAYAAHVLLMRRPDLFTADQGDMWSSGTFIVRSREERQLLDSVQKGIDVSMDIGRTGSGSSDEELSSFVEKARSVIEKSQMREDTQGQELKEEKHDLPEWTTKDKEYISILLSPLVETRSTQTPPSLPLALSIARLISPSSEEVVERGTLARLLSDLGVILPWDSLELSKLTEAENRSMIMSSVPTGSVRGEDELLKGNELDSLREDFTSHKVFVIDDPTASELDDGISLERIHGSEDVWVHIHIADPTRFIPPSHPLAKQASIRGSSTYLPEGNKPLFPLEVIMKELSLGANVDAQGTMTFSARLNRTGEVDETKVRMGWIKKPKVITYQAVDQALGLPTSRSTRPFGGPLKTTENETKKMDIDSSDLDDLKILYDIAKAHRARRYAKAGLEWSLSSASVTLLNQLYPASTNLFDPSTLHSSSRLFAGSLGLDYKVSTPVGGLNAAGLVAEYMILAGRLSAEYCSSRDIPVIYRGSFAPKPLSPEAGTLEDLLSSRIEGTGQVDPFAMMRSDWYRPAGYVDVKPISHWIMGFDDSYKGYIRATSPLRRFDDFLVHWQIKSYLAKQAGVGVRELEKGYSKEEVVGLVRRSDEGTKRAKRAGINANRYWQAKAIQQYLLSSPRRAAEVKEGWKIKDDETVGEDGVLVGKIAGTTASAPSISGEITPIFVGQLGLTASLHHPVLGSELEVGQEVGCRVMEVQEWPNPLVKLELVK
ncbi:hypothetical protein I302_106254 [Kwoniella bestiolae CBS 10118]|uniref:RNB domain-containing protein n=1 Tax=Kwoniella bestiolae CBS 10118 TaxID=1296100 RepID=A0A1B9G3J2_9TREE|nr:hypothetical protein I302_05378 [Kwoniella bestiolae CBS 10118]OCF25558.1 hypothetical protein I302_05378 [Kwoniella bestiolae CBS 10118]